jgi:RimJ/RimL family protein N-acetyltransferase
VVEEDGAFAGRAGLSTCRVVGEQTVELAWALVGDAHGRGLATQAAQAAVEEARRIGLPEVVSFTVPDNVASRRVMEKAGLVFDRDITHAGLPHVLYRLRLQP